MKKFKSRLGFLLLAGVCAVATARAAILVHSNDVLGELEPCGCRSNPQGGIARLANLLAKQEDHSVLFVDAGDLLFNAEVIPDLLKPQSELQAKLLMEGLDKLNLDARVPGEKDYALGIKFFDQLAKKSKSKVLAANLKRGGALAYGDHAIYERKLPDGKKIHIGVFGLVDPKLNWPKGFKATGTLAVAKAQVAALRAKKVDYIVALTHQGFDLDAELAKKVSGISYIVGAHSQSFLQTPPKVGETWILQSSFRNQQVGLLKIGTTTPADPTKAESLPGYSLVVLDAGLDSPKDQPSVMDHFVDDFKKSVGDLNSKRDAEMYASVKTTQDKYHTFAKCSECHLKQFDFWRKTQHSRAFIDLVEEKQNQNKECLQCHTVGLGDPKGYSDVNRIATLTAVDPLEKTEALSPDEMVSFFKFMRSANSLQSKAKLRASDAEEDTLNRHLNRIHSFTPVQCENCHQPGADHPFGGTYTKTVAPTTCLKCHTQERAPDWYQKNGQLVTNILETKRALIQCPAGDLPESD